MLDIFIIKAILVFITAMLTNLIIIFWFARGTYKSKKRNDINAVQASHVIPVARIGGISIIIAVILSALPFLEVQKTWPYYWLLLLSVFPVFLIGLCEDLGYLASPRLRLLAATFSGIIFMISTGLWLPRTDIPVLDFAMQWAPLGVGFSLLVAVGVSHSFNLIDGLNGLAGCTAIGVGLSLAIMSHQVGLDGHRNSLLLLCCAIAGFLVFNYPFGKIFLGDAGAYAIGHVMIWMAISILCASSSITPFAMLLIFFWPVADTLLAIIRRVYLGVPISNPDRLHFHQLVMRGIEIVLLGRKRRHISNPLATALILPLIFAPMVVGVLLALNSFKAMMACVYFAILFVSAYKAFVWMVCRYRYSIRSKKF